MVVFLLCQFDNEDREGGEGATGEGGEGAEEGGEEEEAAGEGGGRRVPAGRRSQVKYMGGKGHNNRDRIFSLLVKKCSA